jgi:hypothetical protein
MLHALSKNKSSYLPGDSLTFSHRTEVQLFPSASPVGNCVRLLERFAYVQILAALGHLSNDAQRFFDLFRLKRFDNSPAITDGNFCDRGRWIVAKARRTEDDGVVNEASAFIGARKSGHAATY